MNTIPTVHNAGSLNIDDVFRTAHIVRPGETIPSRSLERFPGGKGLNQSTALARAGAKVRHIGRIGADGIFLCDGLAAEGADVSGIEVDDTPTGHAIIQVADDGENAIVLYGGANGAWSGSDVQRAVSGMKAEDILLIQNEVNMMPQLIQAAHEAGIRIAMNPAPMTPEVQDWPIECLTWLVVNEIEGRELAGSDIAGGENDRKAVLMKLRRRCINATVVMTLGKEGAIRLDGHGLVSSSFPDVAPVVDTTGAGDTFMGYWLAAEIEGLSPEEGLLLACAAGALSVSRKGAAVGVPHRAEVEALIRKFE